jgi:hypothetical protein
MTEAILTGEKIVKLPAEEAVGVFAAPFAVFAGLAEYLFMGHGP